MQLDFEKAFDSIKWDFMFKVLEKINLGNKFISLVKCSYNDIYSCISNNGLITNWFRLGMRVRKGCPLMSSFYFMCRSNGKPDKK